MKELATAQQKLRAINKLTNCIQKIKSNTQKNDIAWLIHRIIEADDFHSDLARECTAWSIEANSDIFIKI